MDSELITAVIFYAIVAFLIYKNRDKFEVMQKIFIVRKTKWGLNLMKKLARFRLFWKIFSTIAIPVAVYWALKVGQMLFLNAQGIISGVSGAGVGFVVPGVKIPGSPIYIPFWQGIISIAVLAIVHEFAHGIVAAMEGLKIKSTGFGFFLIFPLAFVELDEEEMKEMPRLSRLRIAASGAFANISLWLIISTLLSIFAAPFLNSVTVYDGVNITKVTEGLPADLAGLEGGIIYKIDNTNITTLQDFALALSKHSPGDVLTLHTSEGIFNITTIKNPRNPDLPYLGITVKQESHISKEAYSHYGNFGLNLRLWFIDLFKWIAMLNFLVGIMNFLPIWILDGGLITFDLLSYVIKNQKFLVIVVNLIFSFYLSLLIFNIIGPAFF